MLAINKIAEFTSKIPLLESDKAFKLAEIQARVMKGGEPPVELRADMARIDALISLFKDGVEFFKKALQDFFASVKSLGDLARPSNAG
ncbi:MAG: hypothetical protein HY094_01655 [Candidatus Melainabacteria bacterium]|nr:hypothetical protein [Candidatus Melainabacteria bacterium]